MKFSESHEWIELHNGVGIVGVSNYAQKELGDVVYVELPKVGKRVKAGEEAGVLESTKAASDVYSPVTGTIQEVNQKLVEAPDLINHSPEAEGWIFKILIENVEELETLLEADAYRSQFKV